MNVAYSKNQTLTKFRLLLVKNCMKMDILYNFANPVDKSKNNKTFSAKTIGAK